MSSAITRRLLPRMLAQVSRQHYRSIASSALACEQTQAQQATQQQSQQFYNVPAGHINSDLCNTVCHIGLGRLRDLTLRQDLQLVTAQNGGACTLAQLFKVGRHCRSTADHRTSTYTSTYTPNRARKWCLLASQISAVCVQQPTSLDTQKNCQTCTILAYRTSTLCRWMPLQGWQHGQRTRGCRVYQGLQMSMVDSHGHWDSRHQQRRAAHTGVLGGGGGGGAVCEGV